MSTKLTARQSAICGLMFRGKVVIAGVAGGGYHLGMSYKGTDLDTHDEVFELHRTALTPSDTETFEADLDFDFPIFPYVVKTVKILINGEDPIVLDVELL